MTQLPTIYWRKIVNYKSKIATYQGKFQKLTRVNNKLHVKKTTHVKNNNLKI